MRALGTMGAGIVLLAGSCGDGKPAPRRAQLRQPSGLALAPDGRFLFVTGGNWDQSESAGTVMTLDLGTLYAGLAGPVAGPDAATTREVPCRHVGAEGGVLECDETWLVDPEDTVLLGDGLGNIALDQPAGEGGPWRLLIPQRAPAALAWVDVLPHDAGVRVDCGQDELGVCDEDHQVRRPPEGGDALGPDPSRVVIDDQGFRFAYLPHLLGGELTLIDLDGDRGPEVTSRASEFYREDVFDAFDARGGFAVAGRACDPASAPVRTQDCARPLLYTTHRYWPGLRTFTVASGLEVIVAGGDVRTAGIGTQNVIARPIMADLAFEDPARGESLLLVQTTPAALVRMDTSTDGEGASPLDEVRQTVALCSNPNVLAVHRPPGEEWLALVTCLSDARLAAVGLSTFRVIATVAVGEGANEVIVDAAREQAYVANAREHTISLVSLDRKSPAFLTEWARIGLGAGVRDEG